jgi:phosphoglycolate phosphatase-like HAD superfamily hydrolase
MKKPIIFFDFDGVIADSWAPAIQAQRIICPAITEQEYAQLYTGNINNSRNLDIGHGPDCRHELDFFDVYLPLMKDQVKLFDGIAPVIAQLAEKYTLIIISSTTSPVIQEFLAERNLAPHFSAILGNDVNKKKTEKIKMMLYRYDVQPDETLFITDTLGDLHEAGHMKVPAVAVSWGFNDIPTLQKGNPWRIVHTPADIMPAVDNYFL